MIVYFFLTGFVVYLLLDLYFYRSFKIFLRKKSKKSKIIVNSLYWTLSGFCYGLLIYFIITVSLGNPTPIIARTYFGGIFFITLASKLVGATIIILGDTYHLAEKTIIKSENGITRAEFIKKTGVVMAGIPFIGLINGMSSTAYDYTINNVNLKIPNLPQSFEGFKILQISDIHTGSFISKEPFKEAVELINQQDADIAFFTGDLVNDIAEEALPYAEVLKNIETKMGVYSILGNHDYGDYFYKRDDFKGKQHNRDLMRKIHESMNWDLLLNENRIITKNNESIALMGVENWGDKGRFQKYADLDKVKKGIENHPAKLLLSHDPSHWDAKINTEHKDIACTFSGHTHGMQFGVKLPDFQWSPVQYIYEQWSGLYQKDNQQLYVNTGLGFIGYPGRVGISPEITVFTLHS